MKIYLVTVGLLLMAGALHLFWRRLVVIRKGAVSIGIIESYQIRESDNSLYYSPVVTFSDKEQRSHRFTSVAGYGYKKLPEGASVSVRYHPDKPDMAYVNSFLHLWAAPFAMLLMGVASLSVLLLE